MPGPRRIKKTAPPSLIDHPGNIYGYVRVSHEDSAKSGLSIEAQIDAVQKWVASMQSMGKFVKKQWGTAGWHYEPLWNPQGYRRRDKNNEIVTTNRIRNDGIFVDMAVSAKSVPLAMRPAGGRLYTQVQAGDLIIIARLDRSWRSSIDALTCLKELEQRQVAVQFVDPPIDFSDYIGQFLLRQLISVAEMQSDAIGHATKVALARRRERIKNDPSRQKRTMAGKGCYGWTYVRGKNDELIAMPEKEIVASLRLLGRWRAMGLQYSKGLRRFQELRQVSANGRNRKAIKLKMVPIIPQLNPNGHFANGSKLQIKYTVVKSQELWSEHVTRRLRNKTFVPPGMIEQQYADLPTPGMPDQTS